MGWYWINRRYRGKLETVLDHREQGFPVLRSYYKTPQRKNARRARRSGPIMASGALLHPVGVVAWKPAARRAAMAAGPSSRSTTRSRSRDMRGSPRTARAVAPMTLKGMPLAFIAFTDRTTVRASPVFRPVTGSASSRSTPPSIRRSNGSLSRRQKTSGSQGPASLPRVAATAFWIVAGPSNCALGRCAQV